jgi:lytic murein transglycosylase
MLAKPAHAAAASGMIEPDHFQSFVEELWPKARARHVSRSTFDAAFAGVTLDSEVIALTHKQAEFVRPIGDYLGSAVSNERIEKGRANARAWQEVLAKAQRQFGVNSNIILGVWGMETNFGGFTGNRSTIRCLASLAYVHYRGDYFAKELLNALEILQQGHVSPANMRGSWAGAMGQTQFMPSSFKLYAVDFHGHGRKDIWNDVPDALGSTANYLKRHGWTAGESWGYEVTLPEGFAMAATGRPRPFSVWAKAGVRRANGAMLPQQGQAQLLAPAGLAGPSFLVTHNFKVIKSYNNSTAYALGVALLGDRIAGASPLKAAWPVAQR